MPTARPITGPTKNPPAGYANAVPIMAVDIYPHNGGKYSFVSGKDGTGIIQADVTKNIRDRDGGKFSLVIAPGGPTGVESPTSWTNIININSLVIIYGTRGGAGRIVMIGLVTSIQEEQDWNNSQVARVIKLSGLDFTYYFSVFSYYQLTYLGYLQSTVPTSTPIGSAGFILSQFGRMLGGEPQQLASDYLNLVMLGIGDKKTPAVLDNTFVSYNGRQIPIRKLFSYWFEYFTEDVPVEVFILSAMEISNSEGTWMDKFLAILGWPFYEFFVTTASTDDFSHLGISSGTPATSGPTATLFPAVDFSSPASIYLEPQQKLPLTTTAKIAPAVIGRVTPYPWVEYNTTLDTTGAPPPNSTGVLHRKRWEALTTYSLGSFSFIQSMVEYSIEETANFFTVCTTFSDSLAQKWGLPDPAQAAIEVFGSIISHNSINSFGFIPKVVNTNWWGGSAPDGMGAPDDFDPVATVHILLGKLASYYIPLPYMLRGTVTIPMWLDVIPGSKFEYQPFKNSSDKWLFYIEGVSHTYTYGRSATTTVVLGRGMKSSDYSNDETLKGVLLDNYVRIDGDLKARSDVKTVCGGYYIRAAMSDDSPYSSGPNIIGLGVAGTWLVGNTATSTIIFGDGAGKTVEQSFKDAAAACPTLQGAMAGAGSQYANIPPYKLLQALGMSESTPMLLQNVHKDSSWGIMEVNIPVHPEFDPVKIKNDPYYNIQAGGQVLCKAIAQFGNLKDALAHYKGFNGYDDPQNSFRARTLVDQVLGMVLVI